MHAHLDIMTLIVGGSFVAALSAILITGVWTHNREAPALLWWAASDYVLAVGIGTLAYGMANDSTPALAIGGGISAFAPALVWAGTRAFARRPVRVLPLVAGMGVWLAAGALPVGEAAQKWSTILGFANWIIYLLAANWELWRGRGEPLKARWPLMALFGLHATIFLGGIYDALTGGTQPHAVPTLNGWFGLIHFEAVIYAMGSALFMVLMCKERLELGYIKAADIDALTGIANRGAFFAGAERLLTRCRKQDAPLSVIMFDLDRFKTVNDTYGHAVGDRVLSIFVDIAKSVLRQNDFFGRHGGEEFAVVLPGATIETAYAIAERVRCAFAESSREVDGLRLYTTVSAGVAAASPSASFSAIMEAADQAMYRAKHRGRNRVERADDSRPDGASNIIRVA